MCTSPTPTAPSSTGAPGPSASPATASAEVVGRRCDENLLGHTDLDGARICLSGCPLQDCLDTGREHSINEVFLQRKDGERLAVYVKTAVFEIDGRRYGVEIFGELESVAGKELAGRIQELSDSAVSDPLTGLFNRRYLDAALAQQFAMYKRLGRRYGVIQVDIDEVKAVNDRLGHLTGDEAIKFVADVLSESVREMDVAARFGGDEFVVICALASEADLIAYGRRLVRIVHDSRFAAGRGRGPPRDRVRRRRAGRRRRPGRARRARPRGRGDVRRQASRAGRLRRRRQRERPVTPGGELRRNPVSGKLVIVAPARAQRPAGEKRAGGAPPECPFCDGHEAMTPPEVDAVRPAGGGPDTPGWTIRVVPNKFPALQGRHEVIVHSPVHDAELEDLGDERLAGVLEMWQRRIDAQLSSGAAATTLIGNLGPGSGASLEHPHEQLFATPVVPPLLLDELLEMERHRNRYGACVLCDQIEEAGDRLVLDGPVAAWVPEAGRFNGELWLAPAEHQAGLP